MTKDEIEILLKEIKTFFPRFEIVEKSCGEMTADPAAVDAWHKRIGWMDLEKARRILDNYLRSEDGKRAPGIQLWMSNGRGPDHSTGATATLDRRNGVILWQPEEGGKTYEKKVTYNELRGVWETEDGYDYAVIN